MLNSSAIILYSSHDHCSINFSLAIQFRWSCRSKGRPEWTSTSTLFSLLSLNGLRRSSYGGIAVGLLNHVVSCQELYSFLRSFTQMLMAYRCSSKLSVILRDAAFRQGFKVQTKCSLQRPRADCRFPPPHVPNIPLCRSCVRRPPLVRPGKEPSHTIFITHSVYSQSYT